MKIEQFRWQAGQWEPRAPGGGLRDNVQLVLIFGGLVPLRDPGLRQEIRAAYPRAHCFGCSTAGDIYGTQVSDDSLVVTAVQLERTRMTITTLAER